MKVCSVCQQCYDDTVTLCAAEDQGSLSQAREGNCLTVEGYKIDKKLATASPFEVYKAEHLDSGKSVLIRFIKTAAAVPELKKELESAVAINHPHLGRVYESGEISDNELYVVLEDIAGESLREYLSKKSPLPERNAILIARQIAEGLEALHDGGLIHRAVNPQNIYFAGADADELSVKLQNYDFGGIGQKAAAGGANGIDAKTEIFGYFSPEQFAEGEVDFKTDLYSLAVVFYEMLLGRLPYEAVNPQSIANFVFDESDVEKLHFDLRALLGYTLRQSLQHRLHLRPPSTNNLARQYRHLELVATPPSIGLQKDKTPVQPKQNRAVRTNQTVKTPPVEKQKAAMLESPAPVGLDISLGETPASAEFEARPEISEPKKENGYMPEPASVETVSEKVSVAEEVPVEPVEVFAAERVIQPETAGETISENLFEPFEDTEGEPFEVIDEKPFETGEFKIAADELIVESALQFSEDIHITNKDFDEAAESEFYPAGSIEYSEPEYVEETIQPQSPTDRHIMNSFGAYAQPQRPAVNKTHLYAAGILALVIFGGFLTARVFDGENDVAATDANPTDKPALSSPVRKQENAPKSQETAVIPAAAEENLPQFQEARQTDVPKINEAIIKERYRKNSPDDTILNSENKGTSEKTKDAEAPPAKTSDAKTRVQKRQTAKPRPNRTEEKKQTAALAEKPKPAVKNGDGMTRPRIVSNAKAND